MMDATELQALEPDCKWIPVEVYISQTAFQVHIPLSEAKQ
jgi:hypothetical protein